MECNQLSDLGIFVRKFENDKLDPVDDDFGSTGIKNADNWIR
jgi:hypothetical protein